MAVVVAAVGAVVAVVAVALAVVVVFHALCSGSTSSGSGKSNT